MRFREQLRNEEGASTAEFAICLPAVIFFIALLVGVTFVSGKQNLCHQVLNNVLREAIVLDNSEESLNKLEEIAGRTVGIPDRSIQENGANSEPEYFLDVTYDEPDVEVKVTIPIRNSPISSLIQDVSASAVGRLER
jgi:hypothetical protein